MFKVPYLTDLALVDSRLSKELPWCQTRINSIVNHGLIQGKLERPNCWSGQGNFAVVAVLLMHTPLWFLSSKSVCFHHVPFKINQLFYYPYTNIPPAEPLGRSDFLIPRSVSSSSQEIHGILSSHEECQKKEKAGFLTRNTSWDAVSQLHIQALEGKSTSLSN